jgi:hypothetical protein
MEKYRWKAANLEGYGTPWKVLPRPPAARPSSFIKILPAAPKPCLAQRQRPCPNSDRNECNTGVARATDAR